MQYIQRVLQLHGSEVSGQLVVDTALLLFLSGHMAGGQDGLLGATEWILPDLSNTEWQSKEMRQHGLVATNETCESIRT